jgi:hypothetical protein
LGEEELPAFVTKDTLDLPAAVTLYLAAGKADWLNGRCVYDYNIKSGTFF